MKKTKNDSLVPLEDQVSEIEVSYHPVIKAKDRIQICDSEDAYKIFRRYWNSNTIDLTESFKIMLLTANLKVKGILTVSDGGYNATVVDIKLIFAIALKTVADCLILAHNHPSGNMRPSGNDLDLTRQIIQLGKVHNILVCDHIIVSRDKFYSMRKEHMYLFEEDSKQYKVDLLR